MSREMLSALSGELLDEEVELTLEELCRACQLPTAQVLDLVEEGIVEPVGRDPADWRFRAITLRRMRCARRLVVDLRVNAAGAALALDLLDEIERLRSRLARME